MEKLLTIAEIASQLQVPESTVRFYRDRYSNFYPYRGEGRKKRYTEQAIAVTKRIAELYAENATARDIAEVLCLEFTSEITIAMNSSSSTAVVKKTDFEHMIMGKMLELADQKEAIETLRADQQQLRDRLDQQQKFIEESIIRRDQQLMELLRSKTEIAETKNRSWWKKFLK